MNVEQIFTHLEETKLINILSRKQDLVFIGDELTINYLKNNSSLQNISDNYHYYCWSNPTEKSKIFTFLNNLHQLNQYKIIIASVTNEHLLTEQVRDCLNRKNIKIKSFKLFSDILVSIILKEKKFLQTSDIEFILPSLAYAIITVPRSGSTFLCRLLKSTKLAGFPEEKLRNPAAILARNCHFDYIRYMQILMTLETTPNRFFGTKIISHFLLSYRKKDLNGDNFLKQYFSKYIYLIREDKIAQAVSIAIAQRTKIWHISNQEQQDEYDKKLQQINHNDITVEEIQKKYDFLVQQEKYLEKFFQENQLEPLILKYEELVKNPHKYINDILLYLGID
ncbi:MAG: Stf0 family sulfotransferase, partial [Xenococcus sp. (in: cyanobacteria)]